MERFLLLDISIGPADIVEETSRNPLAVIAFIVVAGLLLYLGIRLILREINKKKGRAAEEQQPAEEKQPSEEMQSAPDASPEADQTDQANETEE